MPDQVSGLLSPFLRRQRIGAALEHLSDGSILDYGCGVGELARHVPPERYLGVERDRESLEKARSGWPAHRFVTPEELDAHPGRMDFGQVVALALIEHLLDPVGWLREMAERLREGGEILLTTPNPRYRRIHELGARVGLFSREGAEEHEVLFDGTAMNRLAEASGLEVVLAKRFLARANQLFLLRPQR